MTIAAAPARPDDAAFPRLTGAALQRAAGVLLLCVVVGRAFVAELPFRMPLLDLQPAPAAPRDAADVTRADRGELARVSFACLLLADATLWLVGAALAGRLVVRHARVAALIGLFAMLSLASVFVASDKRSALDVWVEQLAMMVGCFLAAQCLGDRRGLRLTAAVLVGLGGVLAAKGIHQVLVEIPQTAAYLAAYGRPAGLAGTAAERAFAARVRATTPTGFWGLSNPLASLLVVCVLAAAGLTAERCRRAVRDRPSWRRHRAKGEVHAPAIAAAVTGVLALAVAAALILTRSRGGILAGALVLVAWAVVSRWRATLSAHWRGAVAAVLALFLIGWACVVGYGLATDRLPSKTMTFRWHYWTAAAAMTRDHPRLGVGPGNFPSAYLRYRRLGAEEAVKLPHNVVAEAVSQYGIPGGAVYLAVLVVVLVGMCRPARSEEASLSPPGGRNRVWLVAVAAAMAAVISRWLFSEAGAYPSLVLLDGIVPAALLVAAVLAVTWTGSDASVEDPALSGGLRVALACGAAGVFLHSMVELSLSMAGPATAFWVVAGASLGATGAPGRDLSRLRWVLAGNAVVAAVAAVAIFWWPVYRRTALTEAAMRAWARHDVSATAALAEQAARSDPLDGYAAADAARAVLAAGAGDDRGSAQERLIAAENWAEQALRRDRDYYGHRVLLAEIALQLAAGSEDREVAAWKAATYMGAAMHLNPMDHRLRLQAARMYVDAGKAAEGLAQLEAAEKINAALGRESLMRFESDEEAQVRLLRARAAAMAPTHPAG